MNIFEKNPVAPVHWSNFNLSHEWKGSADMGYLFPIDCVEMLPNDRVRKNTEAFIQFAPMVYPPMQRIDCKIYHFFVPNRILWQYWQKFIYDGKTDTQPAKNTLPINNGAGFRTIGNLYFGLGSLADYLGFPVQQFVNISFNAQTRQKIDLLPFAAYQKIWNDYFRDENLEEDIWSDEEDVDIQRTSLYWNFYKHRGDISSQNLPFVANLFSLRKKAWEKDYFTSALPEPQLGDPVPVQVSTADAQIKVGEPYRLPLRTNYTGVSQQDAVAVPTLRTDRTDDVLRIHQLETDGNEDLIIKDVQGNKDVFTEMRPGDTLPLTIGNLSFTISDLRLASAIQRMQEALARGGHRYKEAMITMYNQITPDFRLDRPEFLASATIPVQVSAVAQTSSSEATSPMGSLAGRAVTVGGNNYFRYHAQEHGFLMTLACIIPRTAYANGLSRMWTRLDRYDYHNPFFENLGDQAIKNKEIYFHPQDIADDPLNDGDFGYAPRFSEYKYIPSTVHGDFLKTLDFMTLTRFFDRTPLLNRDFIKPDDPTVNRAFAVVDDEGYNNIHHLYCTFYHDMKMRRPMQKNPIPKLM